MAAAAADGPAQARDWIGDGATSLGIELGSTRIKAVLIGPDFAPLAAGEFSWENRFVDGLWTYALDEVWAGVQACYQGVAAEVEERYGVELSGVGTLGVSAMMHGYLAFDSADELLVPFRTWRNTNTAEAAERLSDELSFNIPHRWSAAHLFQAVLDDEPHVGSVAFITTLAGYVHWKLTGAKVIGVGDASGMFPIASGDRPAYDGAMLKQFDALTADSRLNRPLAELLPKILLAGQDAGRLSEDGARLLDPSGALQAGVALCPPEGDAGTGMVATNSVTPRTGNVSAGTSIFAMVVLEGPLSGPYRELDLVTTPAGDAVAMVHCNNGASELGSWVSVFLEAIEAVGATVDRREAFAVLVRKALDGDADGGGLVAFNYLSGEPIVGLEAGRPLVLRTPDSAFTLANFIRGQIYSAVATLAIGMDVLADEGVRLDVMFAHGGLFATPEVGQKLMAAALDTPVAVGQSATEGGAWGIAVLAAYLAHADEQPLGEFLAEQVFGDAELITVEPDPADVEGFQTYLERFRAALPVEEAAARPGD